MAALRWCRKYVEMSDQDIEIIFAARKAMLYMNGEPWAKKQAKKTQKEPEMV